MGISDRRSFLTSAIATLGVAATTRRADFLAAGPQTEDTSKKFRIDAHHHFAPPTWVEAMKGNKLLQVANTTWTAEKSLEDMDRGGASAALITIPIRVYISAISSRQTASPASATTSARKWCRTTRPDSGCSPRCRYSTSLPH